MIREKDTEGNLFTSYLSLLFPPNSEEQDPSQRQILANFPHSWFNGWPSICGLNNL